MVGLACEDAEADAMSTRPWFIRHTRPGYPPMWWRPEAKGYTSDIAEAGFFTEEQARSADGPWNEIGVDPTADEAIPPERAVGIVAAEIDTTTHRLQRLTAIRELLNGELLTDTDKP